jgi:putative ABC transport system permease protein
MTDTLRRDLRKTLRGLAANRGFALTVIVTLAAGIAAATVVFSVIQAVLLHPIGLPNPDRLVHLYFSPPKTYGAYMRPGDAGFVMNHVKSLSSAALVSETHAILTGAGEPFSANGLRVSGTYFNLLGAQPEAGRLLTNGDDGVIVLSDHIWRSRFSADPRILGTKISLDGKTHRIIGIAGPQSSSLSNTAFWTPLAPPQTQRQENALPVILLGRLRPGVPIDTLNAELNKLSFDRAREHPELHGWLYTAVPVVQERLKDAPEKLRSVSLASLLLLLTACLNVSGLLLTRASARDGEFALCRALGAGSLWLFRSIFLEVFLLATAACALGVGLSLAALRAIVLLGPSILPGLDHAHLNLSTVLFATGIAFLTAIAASLLPGYLTIRCPLAPDLHSLRRGSSSPSVHRFTASFVAVQFALTIILLTGSGLLLKSFLRLALTPLGLDPANVLLAQVDLSNQTASKALTAPILARLRQIPGVDSVSLVQPSVMAGGLEVHPHIPGIPLSHSRADWASLTAISPDFFHVLRIPIRQGRAFTQRDLSSGAAVIIVNEAAARHFFPEGNAVGRGLVLSLGPQEKAFGIVGVAAATHLEGALYPQPMQIYLPYTQWDSSGLFFLLRTTGRPLPYAASIRHAVSIADPRQPVESVTTLKQAISDSILPERFYAYLFLCFSLAAALVAAVGLYGLLSYAIATRTREIGIRIALGASPSRLTELTLSFGLRAALSGMVLGIAGAAITSRLLTAFLHGIDPHDLSTFALAPLLLALIALLSSLQPLLSMHHIDPAVCLREP